jgi:energy-converting hydrogenase Eha subunit F
MPAEGRCLFHLANKLAIVLLLLGLANLATMAKNGQYYPTPNPARQVSLSTKMNDGHAPVAPVRAPLEKVARIMPPKPRPIVRRQAEPRRLLIRTIGITATPQHRSPPAFLA